MMNNNSLQGRIDIRTGNNMELVDITHEIQSIVTKSTIDFGICHLFNPHTTAGLTINEGADPDVKDDMIKGLKHIVPFNLGYRHMEGNSPSHIMATLTGSSLTVFIENSELVLGTWQKIYFCEYDGPRSRKIIYRITE